MCSLRASLVAQLVESACNVGELGWIPGLGRSTGEGKGYPLQYCGLENSIGCVCSPRDHKESDTSEQLSLSYLNERQTKRHSGKQKDTKMQK